GGYVAFAVARKAQERILSLTLVATTARSDSRKQIATRGELMDLARRGRFQEVVDRLLPILLGPTARQNDTLVRSTAAMMRRVGPVVFIRQQNAIIGRRDVRKDLTGLRLPALVVCGDQDSLTPPELSVEIASSVQRADLRIM